MNFIKKNDFMKIGLVIEIIVCCILLFGCSGTVMENGPDKSLINAELINALNDTAMRNAIISQHSIYPYHFVNNSDKLNELGVRDLAVLADHFKENPGRLNVCRDNTPEALYQDRANFILNQLKEAGIGIDRITVSDGMPGGQGMPSEKVLDIMEKEYQPTQKTTGMSGTTISGGQR